MDPDDPDILDLRDIERMLGGCHEPEQSFEKMLQEFFTMTPADARFHLG